MLDGAAIHVPSFAQNLGADLSYLRCYWSWCQKPPLMEALRHA
jgi:hypothetical protein